MPVEYNKNDGSKKLRFTRNTAYNGVEYGPDYPEQVTVVDNQWARVFLSQNRAEIVKTETVKKDTVKEKTKNESNESKS